MTDNSPLNFELHIRQPLADGSFPVTARVSATDQLVDGLFRLSIDDVATTAFLDALQEGSADSAMVQEFGGRLFDALFTGRIKDLHVSARSRQAQTFRYRLILDDPAVARLPWELLYDRERRAFLALETSMVRGFGLAEPTQPLEVKPPLRILVTAAFPKDLPRIEGQGEIDVILHELAGLMRRKDAEVVPLLNATPRLLQNSLREAAANGRPFHVLHVIGHGALNPTTGQALLFFENEQGQAQPIEPVALADILRPFDLKLIYLNGCETAALSAFDLTQGFAPALMAIGIPAVIGMQVLVWDRVARQVAQDFYAALADNQPVDQAMLSARQLARSEPLQQLSMAVPVCYLRTASGQIVDLMRPDTPRLSRATWRDWLKVVVTPKRLAQGVLGLVGLMSALLGIYWGIMDFRADATTAVLPPMSGQFNIAVAALSQLDSRGSATESDTGRQLSEAIAAQIEVELEGLQDEGFDIELYRPNEVGFVEGASDNERDKNAAELAERLNADLLLHGYAVIKGDSTGLMPILFVSSSHLTYATELNGEFPYGEQIQVTDNIEDNLPAFKQVKDDLVRRSIGLARFAVGLGYFKLNRLSEAARWLEAARDASGDDAKIQRVVLLFLGTTAARQGNLPEADVYYLEALRRDPSYARAHLGQAQMIFQQARHDCSAQNVDAQGLNNAIAGYQEARDLGGLPTEEIDTKAAFYLGQAYLCQALAGDASRWDMAQTQLLRVVNRYQADEDFRVKSLAAEAWLLLGILHAKRSEGLSGPSEELARAEDAFQQAIALNMLDDREATFGYWLARTRGKMTKCDQARQDMANADAALQIFEATNRAVDTLEIQVFRQQVIDELAVRCPMVLR